MKMKFTLASISAFVVLLVFACSPSGSFSVSESEFRSVMSEVFVPSSFDTVGSGMAGGGSEIEYSVSLSPKSSAEPNFDFSAWDRFLAEKKNFTGKTEGGSAGLYWREAWSSKRRVIIVNAVFMKNGNIKATYQEILR